MNYEHKSLFIIQNNWKAVSRKNSTPDSWNHFILFEVVDKGKDFFKYNFFFIVLLF